jgi:hypothetical protein
MHGQAQGKAIRELLALSKGNHNLLSKYLLGSRSFREICHRPQVSRPQRIKEAMEQARENLRRFHHIGFTSELDKFVADLAEGANLPIEAPRHENRNKVVVYKRDALGEEDLAALNEATWLDRPLFQMIWQEHRKN